MEPVRGGGGWAVAGGVVVVLGLAAGATAPATPAGRSTAAPAPASPTAAATTPRPPWTVAPGTPAGWSTAGTAPPAARVAQAARAGAVGPGRAQAEVAPWSPGLVRWRFAAGGPVRATPVVWDGVLYVGGTAGRLHALDVDSGDELWRHDAGSPVIASVAVTADRVFLQDRGGTVTSLRRADGGVVWTRPTGPEPPLPWGHEGWDYVGAAPVHVEAAAGGGALLLVAAGHGNLYAFDPATGDEVWRFETGARLRATPVVDGETVYLGDGAGLFHALDLDDGRERWRFETDGHSMDSAAAGFDRRQIYSAAAVADGRVVFGSRDARVYALDAATGALLWKVDDGTSAWVMGTPTIADGRVVVTRSSSARVRALDLDSGAEIWSLQAGGAVFASPRVVDGTVVVGDETGALLGVDLRTGERRWRYGLGGSVWAAPRLAGGRLYVGSDAGHVVAFDRRHGPAPQLAVYHDDELARRAVLGRQPRHAAIVHFFERRGYQRLDAAGLAEFMAARLADGVPSAVVFAMDALPEAVGEPAPRGTDRPLLRRYLEAGGRVVWLGAPPALYAFDEEGRAVGLDRARPAALLGVGHDAFDGDAHPAWPTDEGRRRGLERWWVATATVPAGVDVTALATDELGRPAAWERTYGEDGRGAFVHLYATTDSGRLDEIRAVVEDGLYRSAATRETGDS